MNAFMRLKLGKGLLADCHVARTSANRRRPKASCGGRNEELWTWLTSRL